MTNSLIYYEPTESYYIDVGELSYILVFETSGKIIYIIIMNVETRRQQRGNEVSLQDYLDQMGKADPQQ